MRRGFSFEDSSEASFKDLKIKEESGKVLCIGCFKPIKEYDLVKIIELNENVPEAKLGEIGAVLIAHESQEYEVECVLESGETKWLGTFKKSHLKWVQTPTV